MFELFYFHALVTRDPLLKIFFTNAITPIMLLLIIVILAFKNKTLKSNEKIIFPLKLHNIIFYKHFLLRKDLPIYKSKPYLAIIIA